MSPTALPLVVVLLAFVLLSIGLFLWTTLRMTGRLSDRASGDPWPPEKTGPVPRRPWWGAPRLSLALAAVWAVVGLVVFPKLFGFTFLLLPFIWIGRPRRRSPRP